MVKFFKLLLHVSVWWQCEIDLLVCSIFEAIAPSQIALPFLSPQVSVFMRAVAQSLLLLISKFTCRSSARYFACARLLASLVSHVIHCCACGARARHRPHSRSFPCSLASMCAWRRPLFREPPLGSPLSALIMVISVLFLGS